MGQTEQPRRELRVHSVPTREERLRTIVEVVAILAAGAWALYTFVYEQRIKPLSENPSFAVPTAIQQGPTINGVAFLIIHKRLENTGNVVIDVAAETLSVFGETVGKKTAPRAMLSKWRDEIANDVPRHVDKLLYSTAKLRNGAVGGNPRSGFAVLPHSVATEDYLVAVPVRQYPVILIRRKDYISKMPISPKINVQIVRTGTGAYDLRSSNLVGEYDSDTEYAIKQ